jgi:predicted AlkP superfamily pyrophosphatase or phosphodiesterase
MRYFIISLCLVVITIRAETFTPTAATPLVIPERASARPVRPFADIDHVVIISIDGLRPDRLLLAKMPALRGLIARGAYTFWAKTTAVAITLPSHTSMLTAVTPRKHGIEWNRDLPLKEAVYPNYPTLFEMARRAGYTTAMVAGKTKFDILNKPGTIQYVYLPAKDEVENDHALVAAEKIIAEHQPEVLFIHFSAVDYIGHKYGWASAEQLAAIEQADGHVQRVLAALARAGLTERTMVIVTSDHGGAGKTHGQADDPRSRYIPWIIAGAHVQSGDLTRDADLVVNTEDTCATACYLLGLSQLPYFDGRPVLAALVQPPAP